MFPLIGKIPDGLGAALNAGYGGIITWRTVFGNVAELSQGGLRCLRDSFQNHTSKEFSAFLFDSLKDQLYYHDFNGGRTPFSFVIESKVVLVCHERRLEILETSAMTLFDQWAFEHLTTRWKERKL